MINDDIKVAQKIVSHSKSNVSEKPYHSNSFIYRTTNEEISKYQFLLENKDSILSVIASGNQILNNIFAGGKNITGFDISTFPKYYLNLQIGALEVFNLDEFIKFFYEDIEDSEYDDMYDLIHPFLDKETKLFWDGLLNYFDFSEIKDSTLFSSEPVFIDKVQKENVYLHSTNNYNKLKTNIANSNITYLTGDIFKLANSLKSGYDLINLSSIVYYNDQEDYKKLLSNLPLNENGEILTYLYDTKIASHFNFPSCEIHKFPDSKSGMLVYKKMR